MRRLNPILALMAILAFVASSQPSSFDLPAAAQEAGDQMAHQEHSGGAFNFALIGIACDQTGQRRTRGSAAGACQLVSRSQY